MTSAKYWHFQTPPPPLSAIQDRTRGLAFSGSGFGHFWAFSGSGNGRIWAKSGPGIGQTWAKSGSGFVQPGLNNIVPNAERVQGSLHKKKPEIYWRFANKGEGGCTPLPIYFRFFPVLLKNDLKNPINAHGKNRKLPNLAKGGGGNPPTNIFPFFS